MVDSVGVLGIGFGKILNQRTSCRDSEHLHSPADTQYRYAVSETGSGETQLHGRPFGFNTVQPTRDLLAIVRGMDVHIATGQNHSVCDIDERLDVVLTGRYEQRHAARIAHRFDVRFTQACLSAFGSDARTVEKTLRVASIGGDKNVWAHTEH